MPSTRSQQVTHMDVDLPNDDSDDPDYRESSADEDDLPPSMGRDRAQWVVDNLEAIEELLHVFRDAGRELFGEAFFQMGDSTRFAHFVYSTTTPH